MGMGTSGLEAAYIPYSATTWIHQTPETHQNSSGGPSASTTPSHSTDDWSKDRSQASSSTSASTSAIDLQDSSLMVDMQGEPSYCIVKIHTSGCLRRNGPRVASCACWRLHKVCNEGQALLEHSMMAPALCVSSHPRAHSGPQHSLQSVSVHNSVADWSRVLTAMTSSSPPPPASMSSVQALYHSYSPPLSANSFYAPFNMMPYGQPWASQASLPLSSYSTLNGATSSTPSTQSSQRSPTVQPMMIECVPHLFVLLHKFN